MFDDLFQLGIIKNTNNTNIDKNKNILLLSLLRYFCEDKNLDYYKVYIKLSNYLDLDNCLDLDSKDISDKYWKNIVKTVESYPDIKSKTIKNFGQIEKIASGSFGTVFKAKNVIDNRDYAIKIVKIHNSTDNLKECQILSCLEHPNIVRYFGAWSELNYVYIQMELCEKDLKSYVLDRYIVTKRDIKYFIGILEGLHYLHSNNIIHRDLKSSNILIDKDIPKISDFNLSKNFFNEEHNIYIDKKNSDNKNNKLMIYDEDKTFGIGTELYSAPEQLNGNDYDNRVDIFSLGLIYYELVTVFKDNFDRIDRLIKLKEGEHELKKNIDKLLICKMLNENYKNRPTTSDIIKILYKRYKSFRQSKCNIKNMV